ncbi:MAG: FtsW/RodA/SpoVE family cell cycle protein [Lachnospiraceae bacterium]|nr:FtsW/RodA/SpoVE family cell cycle protein [Lachnospiraceae bacterium]
MIDLLIELSKYVFIILMGLYTYYCFRVVTKKNEDVKNLIYVKQKTTMFVIHFLANLIIYLKTGDPGIIIFYLAQMAFFIALPLLYNVIYPKSSKLLINNMCMLLMIGFIMLTRLAFTKAVRQFEIAVISAIVALFIPYFIKKLTFLRDLTWFYAGAGIILLAIVFIIGQVTYGAKLSFEIAGIGIQPSEFVKIIYVFFIASMLSKAKDLYQIVQTSIFAAIHVIILVISKDLGSALIFFIAYLFMLFIATHNVLYLGSGFLAGSVAAIAAYYLFHHVRVRVLAFTDPFSVIDNEGYQVTQSLFAIGTGGWFGMGLYQGYPKLIPVVEEDFIFSAISEEFGILFALCVILVYLSCFIMFINIAMQIKDDFFCLCATGLACILGFQTFLTIGGAVKFIPSTGVTLPLISYGGSSCFSTLIIFAIIQGIYIYQKQKPHKKRKKEASY